MTTKPADYHYAPLPQPMRITDHRWPEGTMPLVTITCITYNHATFIRDAIEGFLMQETTFPVEILIHDDASPDGTADIVRQYAARYPALIRPVYQTENQHSQGRTPGHFLRPLLRGKYIAVCEGDDYWITRNKLQRQFEILESHPGLDLCFHRADQLNLQTGETKEIGCYRNADGPVQIEEIITKEKGQIPTASTFIRVQAWKNKNDFVRIRPWLTVGDIYLHIFGAVNGGAHYINDVMSVYRYLAPGSWNARWSESTSLQLKHARARIKSYKELNNFLGSAHSEAFRKANRQWTLSILNNYSLPYPTRVVFGIEHLRYLGLRQWLHLLPDPAVRFIRSVLTRWNSSDPS